MQEIEIELKINSLNEIEDLIINRYAASWRNG